MLDQVGIEAVTRVLGILLGLGLLALFGWLILRGAKALVALGSERARREASENREKAVEKRVEALMRQLPRGSALRRRWDKLRDARED